ncbi:MAG: hypothetical protein QOE80_1045 [Actinomycetota bacterium]|jgi:hypothetical protein|nr:hypothetical protein [Actinomycetota bacterium]
MAEPVAHHLRVDAGFEGGGGEPLFELGDPSTALQTTVRECLAPSAGVEEERLLLQLLDGLKRLGTSTDAAG